jgi:hypothetical protein
LRDGHRVGLQEIHDPFVRNTTTMGWSLWDWFAMLWRGRETTIEIIVRGDDAAHDRWFRDSPTQALLIEAVVALCRGGECDCDPPDEEGPKEPCPRCVGLAAIFEATGKWRSDL